MRYKETLVLDLSGSSIAGTGIDEIQRPAAAHYILRPLWREPINMKPDLSNIASGAKRTIAMRPAWMIEHDE